MKKQFFKKLTACVLSACAVLIPGVSLCAANAGSDTVKFAVGTDIHVGTATELNVNYPENELYFQAEGSGNIYDQAAALTKDFIYNSVSEGAEFILIVGDLTRGGNEEQHRYTASLLGELEQETGVPVYVVPGNHDYFNSKPDEFREYYNAFGYDEALEQDSATASYTADLGEKYRLIAVDSNNPGKDGDGITDALIDWVGQQAAKAREDGREIIYMEHHPILEHLYLGHILMKDFMVRDSETIAEKYTQWGIRYVFTGHEHGNDVAAYTGENGGVLYDVLTTALSSYPLEYRFVTMTDDGADLKMRKIENCRIDELCDGYTDAQKALLESDYEAFAYGLFRYSVEKKILKIIAPSSMKNYLKGVPEGLVDSLFGAICDALEMPLYDSGEGVSIEKLANSKGVELPRTDYGSLIELASAMVAMHYYGDENIPAETNPECELLVKGLNTGLQYVLTKTGRNGLNELLGIIGTQVDTEVLSPLFTAVSLGKEDSYKVAEKVLYPLLNRFAVDFSLPDRDVYLQAEPDAPAQAEPTFFDRIKELFTRVIEAVRKLFAAFIPA